MRKNKAIAMAAAAHNADHTNNTANISAIMM